MGGVGVGSMSLICHVNTGAPLRNIYSPMGSSHGGTYWQWCHVVCGVCIGIFGMDTHVVKQVLCATAYACTKTRRVGQHRYHKVARRTPFIGLATCLLTGIFVSSMYVAHTTAMLEVIVDIQMITLSTHLDFTPSKHTNDRKQWTLL